MKTKIFPIKYLIEHDVKSFLKVDEPARVYKIPTLSAYAIQSSTIEGINEYAHELPIYLKHRIEGEYLKWFYDNPMFIPSAQESPKLRITYLGIKNYEELFPYVEPIEMRIRLAEMFEEADKAFEHEMWLSYIILAGAVCEGVLSSVLKKDCKFFVLINLAREQDIISEAQKETLHEVRVRRNQVHPNTFDKGRISREVAMELYLLIDELMQQDWLSKLKAS